MNNKINRNFHNQRPQDSLDIIKLRFKQHFRIKRIGDIKLNRIIKDICPPFLNIIEYEKYPYELTVNLKKGTVHVVMNDYRKETINLGPLEADVVTMLAEKKIMAKDEFDLGICSVSDDLVNSCSSKTRNGLDCYEEPNIRKIIPRINKKFEEKGIKSIIKNLHSKGYYFNCNRYRLRIIR